jgi:DNA-binding response OmpR family regulator
MESLRILVVERETRLRSTLRLGLQLAGYLVAEAADGRQALEIVREEPPDLVLLDLRIPVIGSVALMAELRASHLRPHPRVTVMTDPNDLALAIEALGLGASDFLQKPISVRDALSSIESILRAPREHFESTEHEYSDVLEAVRVTLQTGKFGAVEPAFLGPASLTDAACLNLAGIVQEAHGRIDNASKLYERATLADSDYWAARENLLRLRELQECGETNRAVLFREVQPIGRE